LTITVSAVGLAFISSIASQSETSVLSVVQLLWLNLIQDTLAALALATDPPIRDLLDRPPELRASPIVTFDMWKMILGQSLVQIAIGLVLNFAGAKIFSSWSPLAVSTVVFNTYVWLQISNLLNCRRIDSKLNVFAGVFRNYLFIAIFFFMVASQIIIVFVGGNVFSVTRLNGVQWAVSLVLGILSLPAGVLLRLLPNKYLRPIFRPFYSISLPRIGRRQAPQNVGNAEHQEAAVDLERATGAGAEA
jgi:P-type Ca2+ transporter type 2C